MRKQLVERFSFSTTTRIIASFTLFTVCRDKYISLKAKPTSYYAGPQYRIFETIKIFGVFQLHARSCKFAISYHTGMSSILGDLESFRQGNHKVSLSLKVILVHIIGGVNQEHNSGILTQRSRKI